MQTSRNYGVPKKREGAPSAKSPVFSTKKRNRIVRELILSEKKKALEDKQYVPITDVNTLDDMARKFL